MCLENGVVKAYGAGVMGSLQELAYCVTGKIGVKEEGKPLYKYFDPYEIERNHQTYPITAMQDVYFLAESFSKIKD